MRNLRKTNIKNHPVKGDDVSFKGRSSIIAGFFNILSNCQDRFLVQIFFLENILTELEMFFKDTSIGFMILFIFGDSRASLL